MYDQYTINTFLVQFIQFINHDVQNVYLFTTASMAYVRIIPTCKGVLFPKTPFSD